MAEQEKLPNKERRALAREERKRKAAEEAKAAKKRKLISGASTALVLVLVGAVVVTAFNGRGGTLEPIVLNSATVEEARDAAGCEVVSEEPLVDRQHFDPVEAPEADVLYTGPRPTHSGSHYTSTHPIVTSGSNSQLEERATTHNLEHGSIIAWYDPEKVDNSTVNDMEDWSETLNENGFTEPRAGTAIFVSPYTEPGISSGKAIAFRGWGIAMDCDEWNEDVANGFVVDRYGSHGIAPERNFAPYPEDTISYEDREVEDNTTAPTGEGDTETPMDPVETESDGATEDATEPDATEEPSPTETATE